MKRTGAGKLVVGILLGGVVGATLGWLTSPASGTSIRRKLRGERVDVRERFKTAEGNVESQARELADEVSQATAIH